MMSDTEKVRYLKRCKTFRAQVRAAIINWNLRDVPATTRSRISRDFPLTLKELQGVANAFFCSINYLHDERR